VGVHVYVISVIKKGSLVHVAPRQQLYHCAKASPVYVISVIAQKKFIVYVKHLPLYV
jgi:hypothetical protein